MSDRSIYFHMNTLANFIPDIDEMAQIYFNSALNKWQG